MLGEDAYEKANDWTIGSNQSSFTRRTFEEGVAVTFTNPIFGGIPCK
ncbi:MAG TPA: hypothetical protein PKH60_04975 [Candidatus Woesebacteria bacterium]|nr:hypothetical protein [Candidatus Woesebacteria bacterium]